MPRAPVELILSFEKSLSAKRQLLLVHPSVEGFGPASLELNQIMPEWDLGSPISRCERGEERLGQICLAFSLITPPTFALPPFASSENVP